MRRVLRRFAYSILTVMFGFLLLPTMAVAKPALTLSLDKGVRAEYSVYRSYVGNGLDRLYYRRKGKDHSHLAPFTGWRFNVKWGGNPLLVTPRRVALKVDPALLNDPRCSISREAKGLQKQKLCGRESVFHIARDGRTVVLNPNIPKWYTEHGDYKPEKQSCYERVPSHALKPRYLKCRADVYATASENGQIIASSKPVKITVKLYPTPVYKIPPIGEGKDVIVINHFDSITDHRTRKYLVDYLLRKASLPLSVLSSDQVLLNPRRHGSLQAIVFPTDIFSFPESTQYAKVEAVNNGVTYTKQRCYYKPTIEHNGAILQDTNRIPLNGQATIIYAHWKVECLKSRSQKKSVSSAPKLSLDSKSTEVKLPRIRFY